MVDGVRDDEWMFAPERMGGVSLQPLVAMCYSGAYTKQNIMDLIRGKGGLMAHLGTASAQEVEQRIVGGDVHAKLVYDGMLYSCARGRRRALPPRRMAAWTASSSPADWPTPTM